MDFAEHPILPENESRQLHIAYQVNQPSNGLAVELVSAPRKVREWMLFEVVVGISNTTDQAISVSDCMLEIEPSDDPVSLPGSSFAGYGNPGPSIQPGEELSLEATIRIASKTEASVTLQVRLTTPN